jgi:hypothetical protein
MGFLICWRELKFLFFVAFIFLATVSNLSAEKWERVRNRSTEPGIYVMHAHSPSVGLKVAELKDVETAEAYMKEAGFLERDDLRLFAVGLPLTGHVRRETVQEIKEHFENQGLSVRVRAITHPDGLVEKILMFSPLVEDAQMPTKSELISSSVSWLLGTASFSFIMLTTQPTEVAVPVIIVNALQSAAMTFPRQAWGNYFARTRNFPEKVLKQFALTYIFTLGLMAANHGAVDGVDGLIYAFTLGLWHIISQKGLSVAFQILWRVPAENNIPTWIVKQTEAGHEKRARSFGSWYRALSTNIATPAWGYSVINDKQFFGGAYGNWNWGHVVMLGVGLTHQLAGSFPIIYEAPMKASAKIHSASKKLGQSCRNFVSRLGL